MGSLHEVGMNAGTVTVYAGAAAIDYGHSHASMNPVLDQHIIIRTGVFIAVLVIMLLWESLRPRRFRRTAAWPRRINNLLLVAVDTLLLRVVMAVAAITTAGAAMSWDFGLLHRITIPYWLAFVLSVILLDLVIYGQHVLFHKVGFLWRLHRVHHTDKDLDATTGVRFHPVEILLSMGIKLGAVAALGPPVLAVLAFEVILNATAMFNHSNVAIPVALDRWLRWFIVTPDMHRVHHSVLRRETDSNYGFNLPWWDRLFGTYRAQPAAGHPDMELGLAEFRNRDTVHIAGLLLQPVLNIERTPVKGGTRT